MRPYSIDEHWELLKLRYEERGKPVPGYWVRLYRVVCRLFALGAR
jgi:hypothetical protein